MVVIDGKKTADSITNQDCVGPFAWFIDSGTIDDGSRGARQNRPY